MTSVDVPNVLSHGHVHSIQKNTQSEEIQLSEVNSRPTPPEEVKRSTVSKTSKRPTLRARIQFLSLCWTLFLIGWSDASTGPLLPRLQSTYHVLFLCLVLVRAQMVVLFRSALLLSPLFSYRISSCAENCFISRRTTTLTACWQGSLVGSTVNVVLNDKLGFGKVRYHLNVSVSVSRAL